LYDSKRHRKWPAILAVRLCAGRQFQAWFSCACLVHPGSTRRSAPKKGDEMAKFGEGGGYDPELSGTVNAIGLSKVGRRR
jgi:hypothetical protein